MKIADDKKVQIQQNDNDAVKWPKKTATKALTLMFC